MKCDVLIVGAGISGLYLARELAKKKIQVIVIDQSKVPGEPNFSTAGTQVSTVEKFSLPKNGIAGTVSGLGFGTSSSEQFWRSSNVIGYTLDFRKTKQLLAKEASDAGATVLWDVKATGVKKNAEECVIGTSNGDIECSYAVDAAGSSRVLFTSTGIGNHTHAPCDGIEIIVDDTLGLLTRFQHTMFVYFDVALAPFGYAWVFDNGNHTYKVGLGEADINSNRHLTSLESRLEAFVHFLIQDKTLPIVEKHGHSIFYLRNQYSVQQGRIVAIGDAAGMLNPFFGEGIRHSLYSAQFVFESIEEHIRDNSLLSGYEKKINTYKNSNWRMTAWFNKALYRKNTKDTQELYESLMKYWKYMNLDDFMNLAFGYSIRPIVKGFPHNIPLIASFIKAIL